MPHALEIDRRSLISLAQKYETSRFLDSDPSKFMHRYENPVEQEIVAFLAANLAFGQRKQILSHVEFVLREMGASPKKWILDREFESVFGGGKKSFYRMYSHDTMKSFFALLCEILEKSRSLGEHFEAQWKNAKSDGERYLFRVIASNFHSECKLVPHTATSAAKRLNMFLRWMVRDNSPVDLGLWKWFCKTDLLMPLDTHVMQEATKFGFLSQNSKGGVKSANLKTCVELTEKMKKIFQIIQNMQCSHRYKG